MLFLHFHLFERISRIDLPHFWLKMASNPTPSLFVTTLDTVADEIRKKMADGVARSPSRLCSRDGKICCYGDALSTIFLHDFVPCFLLFVFRFSSLSFLIFFPASGDVYLLRVPSSAQQLSATLSKCVFYSTCSFCLLRHSYTTPSRNSFVFYSSEASF